MRGLRVAAVLLLGALNTATRADSSCLEYGPAEVALEGLVEVVTFPGVGVEPFERNVVLQLRRSICLSGSHGLTLEDRSNTPMSNVRRIVLAFSNSAEEAHAIALRRVNVTGTLWRAETGHFSEDLAMTVTGLKAER